MADGTVINPMAGGDTIQTEDFGASGKIQRVKIAIGAKDVDSGDATSSTPLPTNDSSLNTVEGTTADAAVTSDVNGTASGKLRGLVKMLADMWDSVNHRMNVYIQNASMAVTGTVTANAGTGTFSTSAAQSGTWTVQPGNTQNTTPWLTQSMVGTSKGWTPYKLVSAATTNATSVKATAGNLGLVQAFNNSSTIYYLKVYDKASAPTVGTDTPKKTYLIPGNSTNGAGFTISFGDAGESFANGIAFAITGGITDADTTACAANAVVINLDYN